MLSQGTTCMLQESSFHTTVLVVWCYHKIQPICYKSPASTQLCLQYDAITRTNLYVTRVQVLHSCVCSMMLSQEPTCMLKNSRFYTTVFAVWCYHKNQPVCYKIPGSTQLSLQYDVITRTNLYVTRFQFLHNCVYRMMLSQEPNCTLQKPSFYAAVFAVWCYHKKQPVCYNSPVSTLFSVWFYHKIQPVCYKSPVFTQLFLQYDVTRNNLYVSRAQFLRNIF